VPKRHGLNNEKSSNLKFKPYNIYITNQTWKDFIQASEIHSELLVKHFSYYSDTRVVTALPPSRNLISRFGRSSGPNRNSERSHISSLWQHEVWMARIKKVLTFPSFFISRVVVPLYLEELDCFTPHNMILRIQDLDWVLGVRVVGLNPLTGIDRQHES
jgi:hypothetical protein